MKAEFPQPEQTPPPEVQNPALASQDAWEMIKEIVQGQGNDSSQ